MTVVATELATKKFVLAARVAVIVHVPGDVAFKIPLATPHPAVPAEITVNEYPPLPEPPVATSVRPVAYTPFVVVSDTADCVA